MESISGKKIFVLYPDEHLRANIFYGSLRNRFAVYYIHDYEKIRLLAEYYPESIIVLNLISNELDWLPEELHSELSSLPEDKQPTIIALYDNLKPSRTCCTRSIHYQGNNDDLKAELEELFIQFGGKGRRNFVRYGGSGENVATMKLKTEAGDIPGIVHDISASGLSCSTPQLYELSSGDRVVVELGLDAKTVELEAFAVLLRDFGSGPVLVLKFSEGMPADSYAELLGFIYKALDSEMNEFIKNLSN